MKTITEYLIKKKLDKIRNKEYEYKPETRKELVKTIKDLLDKGETNLNCIDVSNIHDMSWLFSSIIIKDKKIDISEWDVSDVTNMEYMFFGIDNFDCDLSNWDVSNVKNMGKMFHKCKKFTGKGLENWNVSKVENMDRMFYGCEILDCDLSNWNVSNVKDMTSMFNGCKIFTGKGLENWNVSNVSNMKFMFVGCEKFNHNLSNWNIKKYTITYGMFNYCASLKNKPKWYKK